MARQDVNIGVEGNDGTGDSIRESFRKVNENFQEVYAIFGQSGTISFTALSDTPDALLPNTIPLVKTDGSAIDLVELASNNALDSTKADTIAFNYTVGGMLAATLLLTLMYQQPAHSSLTIHIVQTLISMTLLLTKVMQIDATLVQDCLLELQLSH